MTGLVPNRFLFDFEFPLAYQAKSPRIDGAIEDWKDRHRLPLLGEIDTTAYGTTSEFGEVWVCWNESGLFITWRVQGKHRPLKCDPRRFWESDHLRLCTDMRDARSNKRATRFCQQFYFLPTGGGPDRDQPVASVTPIKRAREDAPPIATQLICVASKINTSGYTMKVHIPAECLSGFDPLDHPRIGFYYILEDLELGQQYLTIGDNLYWYIDPSTWATAVLKR